MNCSESNEHIIFPEKIKIIMHICAAYLSSRIEICVTPNLLLLKFCFSPAEETRRRAADARSKRKRPLKYEYRKRKPQPKRRPGEKYTTASYRKAIHRGCDAAFKPPKELEGEQALQWAKEHRWAPNRVRHTTATAVRKRFGLEAAQVILGHSHADVTQMYAEVNMEKGIEVIRQIG